MITGFAGFPDRSGSNLHSCSKGLFPMRKNTLKMPAVPQAIYSPMCSNLFNSNFIINIEFQPEAGQLLINYHYYFIKIKTASQPKFSLVSSVFHRYGPNFPQK